MLLTEEAYVVRDLTLLGSERPGDVFDTARTLFVQRFELTVHQRLTRALAMGGIEANEKPSQWMPDGPVQACRRRLDARRR